MRAKVFIATAIASVAGSVVIAAPAAHAESTASAFTSRLATLVNEARAQHGLRALTVASGTSTVASNWSSHMSSSRTLAHNPNLQSQLESHGSANWTTYGENVGEGPSSSADQLFNAYMNSPEHRANILGSGYRYLGIATSFSGGVAWNTMDFVDQYGGTTTHTTTTAPKTTFVHRTATVTHHATTPKATSHPAVRKAPAPRHTVRVKHTVAVQHLHASRHADTQRPYTDLLVAAGQPVHIGAAGSSSSDSTRLLASLVAAALIAAAGISWAVRRRVAA